MPEEPRQRESDELEGRATKRETEGCRGAGHVENVAPRASQGRRFVGERAGNGADRRELERARGDAHG